MSDKQKTETAVPAEVKEEALDQVNGGLAKDTSHGQYNSKGIYRPQI